MNEEWLARELHRKKCTEEAVWSALTGALGALAVSAPIVYAANTYSPTFRTRLNVSGKTALVSIIPEDQACLKP
ncbi:hypothetical protein CYMTET_45512 [Cymbomonas tetramitiformis]|uniref:Uncharacterized protein n=1 Tax=Cymbomonas tetramitiformis TaxID=36881 RepID=A0AAE0EY90_9CHLO|nr:hypothetical protein CYMTET_45512 [Cymbomonas tetramitiformis]